MMEVRNKKYEGKKNNLLQRPKYIISHDTQIQYPRQDELSLQTLCYYTIVFNPVLAPSPLVHIPSFQDHPDPTFPPQKISHWGHLWLEARAAWR